MTPADIKSRARGCMLGQLAGDALGSLVEFMTPQSISRLYPEGVRDLRDGGSFNTIAGQPTDDSEMALMLARSLIERGEFDREHIREAYLFWLYSEPFDCGGTVYAGLMENPNLVDSQANGSLMRISPLGIFGANYASDCVSEWAVLDALITHPNSVCVQAMALFAMSIAHAIRTGCDGAELYSQVRVWADDMNVEDTLFDAVLGAADAPPDDYITLQGWVLVAFRNAFWQLLHAPNLEEGVIDTVMRGGDTDTNAAICGALMGSVYGQDAVPSRWVERVLDCRPEEGLEGVFQPRPEIFWPVDAIELADRLILLGDSESGLLGAGTE